VPRQPLDAPRIWRKSGPVKSPGHSKLVASTLQRWPFKTGGGPIRHARYFVLQLADSHLTSPIFSQILGRDRAPRVASDLRWGYRTRLTGVGGKERRTGGVFERHARRYHTRRQRVAQALGFTAMTAVEGLGSVDELTDGTGSSVDTATGR
jgi:hypothetical protein